MKRLTRNRNDKVLFGVCGGIGKYFDIDPVIIRILFIILLFTAGIGFISYIVAIFIIPEEEKSYFKSRYTETVKNNSESPISTEEVQNNEIKITETEATHSQDKTKSSDKKEVTGTIIGIILIVFGALFLMRNFSFLDNIYYSIMPAIRRFFWPGLLIGLGALVIYKNRD